MGKVLALIEPSEIRQATQHPFTILLRADVVAKKMKSVKSDVPIMLLSAYGPLPKKKLQAVDTFLSKSQPPQILLSTLQALLNNQSKPFFSRWLDTWRGRIEGAHQ